MSLPTPQLITNVRRAGQTMANRETPLIYNEWYVAAFEHEIDRHLLARRLLDRRSVMYRTLEGEPVALEDRCAHRSFPLSKSRLEGNDIICGYHGFRYDEAGYLKEVPSQKTAREGLVFGAIRWCARVC
uniref:Rieske 2Fe-2S domain-containing protein n=1 Tax=Pseudomonas veronii TaxID=76761 RepID=UPI003C7BDCA0